MARSICFYNPWCTFKDALNCGQFLPPERKYFLKKGTKNHWKLILRKRMDDQVGPYFFFLQKPGELVK